MQSPDQVADLVTEVAFWSMVAVCAAIAAIIAMDYRRNLFKPVWEVYKQYEDKPIASIRMSARRQGRSMSMLPSDSSLCKVKAWSEEEALKVFYDHRFAGCRQIAIDSAAELGFTYRARRAKQK